MDFQELYNKWRNFVNKMNDQGVPVPMIRYNGKASVSLTLLFMSSIWVQLGLLGKVANAFNGINIEQALQFFYACSALHFGTSFTSRSGAKLGDTTEPKDNERREETTTRKTETTKVVQKIAIDNPDDNH